MRFDVLVMLSVLSVALTMFINIVSIVLNLLHSRKYYHAKYGIENVDFPSSYGFTYKDLVIDEEFCANFRGSVRLGSLNIFTDEQIEVKREKAKLPLP